MATTQPDLQARDRVKMLIGGRWEASRSARLGPVYNPSNGSVIASGPVLHGR